MSLKFIFGGAGAGKTHRLLQNLIDASEKEPNRRFLILVPEQATMETQRQLVRLHPRHGILNIDVLSITRLAYRVFSETGFRRESMLEEIGKTFLLEKVALETRGLLEWFGGNLSKPEYLAQMKALISELMLYGVTPEMLEEQDFPALSPMRLKTADLAVVYRAFLTRLHDEHHMTAEEIPERLASLIPSSGLVRDSVIALDGFTGFTPVQLELIKALLPAVRDMYVTVTMDPDVNPFGPYDENDLFTMGYEMAHSLQDLADKTGVPLDKPVYLHMDSHSRQGSVPELVFLEKYLFRSGETRVYAPGEDPAIRIYAAADAREEVAFAAREISRLVRTCGYRYRDFAVVTGDLTSYGSYVRQIFPRYDIPCFIDEKRSLIRNPFMEYLRASLEAVSEDYSASGIFRMLKSGMTDIDKDEYERLENYVLGCGIRGKKRWRERFTRHYRGEDPGEVPKLDKLRERVCALLDPLADAFSKRGSTVAEKTEALYEFCVRTRAEEKLRAREKELTEEGRTDLAREYAQVYPYVCSFLDKLVATLGEESVSMRDYRALVEAGFAEARVAIIPPGNDQVLVGDLTRSRIKGVKVLFFAGVNEGIVPAKPSEGGILSETDRQALAAREIRLRPAAREQAAIDRFYLYLTMTIASEKLILSYAGSGTSGELMRPSYLIRVIQNMFPGIRTEKRPRELYGLIENPKADAALLAEGLMEIEERVHDAPYLEMFRYFANSGAYGERVRRLLKAAQTRKRDDPISAAAARALYGAVLRGSASRLELFSGCEFAHFLTYGLRLKERPEYGFSGLDMGSVLHTALEYFAIHAEDGGRTWAGLSEDEEALGALAARSMEEAVRREGSAVFSDSARNSYQVRRMERLLRTSARTLGKQLMAGDFVPGGAEQSFKDMVNISLTRDGLPGGMSLMLGGRIDRVDLCEAEGRVYVKIIDYKTGNVGFDITEVYYGLQMQLVLYLRSAMDALRKAGKNPVPAGVFYYQVKDPVVKYVEGETGDDTSQRILRELKNSGVVLNEGPAIRHLDKNLLPGNASDVIPVTLKKGGEPDSKSKVLTEDGFRTMMRHTDRLIALAAQRIACGEARINPYEYKQRTACDYCPYRGICGFDPRIPGYETRVLVTGSIDEMLQRMEDESERPE